MQCDVLPWRQKSLTVSEWGMHCQTWRQIAGQPICVQRMNGAPYSNTNTVSMSRLGGHVNWPVGTLVSLQPSPLTSHSVPVMPESAKGSRPGQFVQQGDALPGSNVQSGQHRLPSPKSPQQTAVAEGSRSDATALMVQLSCRPHQVLLLSLRRKSRADRIFLQLDRQM